MVDNGHGRWRHVRPIVTGYTLDQGPWFPDKTLALETRGYMASDGDAAAVSSSSGTSGVVVMVPTCASDYVAVVSGLNAALRGHVYPGQ